MKNQYRIDKQGKAVVPFFVELSLEDFGGDRESYRGYLDELRETWKSEAAQAAEEDQPLRSEFAPDSVGERAYSAALQSWSVERGVSKAMAANRPKPSVEQLPRELAALHFGDKGDKKKSIEVMQWRGLAQEQLSKAIEYEQFDGPNSTRVRDAKQRAAQYQREVDKLQKQQYSFEAKGQAESVKWGEAELEKAMLMNPSEVAENLDHLNGLVQGYRKMADTDYSFAIDGKQVVKIKHPHLPANEIHARIGTTEDRQILERLRAGGIERHEEPAPAPKEVEARSTRSLDKLTNKEFAAERERQEKPKGNDFNITVAPGMFGG
jgi:hypothetical protein